MPRGGGGEATVKKGAATREDGGLWHGEGGREEGDWCCHGGLGGTTRRSKAISRRCRGQPRRGPREEDGMVEMFAVGAQHGWRHCVKGGGD